MRDWDGVRAMLVDEVRLELPQFVAVRTIPLPPVHCVATRELCEAPGMLALGFGCDTIAVEAMQVLGNVVDSLRQIITMGDKDRRRSLTASTRAARSFTG
jgi:hypothetical protein